MWIAFLLYIILVVFCLFVYIWNRKQLKCIAEYIIPLLIIVLIVELPDELGLFNHVPLDNIYQVLEFVLLSLVYYHALNSYWIKRSIIYLIPFYLVYATVYHFIYGIDAPNTLGMALPHLFIVIYSLLFVRQLYNPPFLTHSIFAIPLFWISIANLFYFTGMFFHFAFENYIAEHGPYSDVLKITRGILNYLLYSLYITGGICQKIYR